MLSQYRCIIIKVKKRRGRRNILRSILIYTGSQDSAVGIANGYGLGNRGVGVQV
jgi:hypothetical protein